jgi:transposase InsO family protein
VEPVLGPAKPDQWDNALTETIKGRFTAEVIWRQGLWSSLEAVEYATLERVDWYSHKRLLEPIGYVPPAEAEAAYYAAFEEPAIAA